MPAEFVFAGFDPNARRAFLAHVDSYAALGDFLFPIDEPFVLFLGGDATTATHEELRTAASRLLASGAVYVLTWGRDCERVQSHFNDVIASSSDAVEEGGIITTAHPDESIVVALAFAANFAAPAEEFNTHAIVIALVGEKSEFNEAHACLEELLEDQAPVAEG